MRVPVIFERDVAASLLDDLFAAVSAANIATGNSWLSGRIGNRIGSELVTIIDDGRVPAGLGSSPFDGEGVPTRRTAVFDRGRAAVVSLRYVLRAQAWCGQHRKLHRRRGRAEQLLP